MKSIAESNQYIPGLKVVQTMSKPGLTGAIHLVNLSERFFPSNSIR